MRGKLLSMAFTALVGATLAGAMLAGDTASARTNCASVAYIMYFDAGSAAITADGAEVLDNVITTYGICEGVGVFLTGHTDRKGKRAVNQKLSQKMVDNVRAYLVSRSISGEHLSGTAYGEDRPRVATRDGVRERQNRRVEITFGPASGF